MDFIDTDRFFYCLKVSSLIYALFGRKVAGIETLQSSHYHIYYLHSLIDAVFHALVPCLIANGCWMVLTKMRHVDANEEPKSSICLGVLNVICLYLSITWSSTSGMFDSLNILRYVLLGVIFSIWFDFFIYQVSQNFSLLTWASRKIRQIRNGTKLTVPRWIRKVDKNQVAVMRQAGDPPMYLGQSSQGTHVNPSDNFQAGRAPAPILFGSPAQVNPPPSRNQTAGGNTTAAPFLHKANPTSPTSPETNPVGDFVEQDWQRLECTTRSGTVFKAIKVSKALGLAISEERLTPKTQAKVKATETRIRKKKSSNVP